MTIPTMRTQRLVLRPFSGEDVGALYRILGEKGLLRYFPTTDPPPRDRVQKMISGSLRHWAERGYGLWAVASPSNGEFMGRCGLQYLPETDEVEVDFLLGRAFWGQGFATEAARASVRYGFEEWNFESLVGIVHPENKASQRVLQKLGMECTEQTVYFGMECYRYALKRSAYDRASESWETDAYLV
jgi:RimJ/RimL family protein N-acetyltransferase